MNGITQSAIRRGLDLLIADMHGVDIDSASLAQANRLLLIGRLVAKTLSRHDHLYASVREIRALTKLTGHVSAAHPIHIEE